MGWTPQQLWDATIPEILEAYRGYQDRERRADWRVATLTTWYANAHRDREKHPDPFAPADFFPSLQERKEKQPEPTLPEVRQQLDALERRMTGATPEDDE